MPYLLNHLVMRRFDGFFSAFSEKWKKAAMAEWFKATDLRPVIYDAWVRTPLAAIIASI